MHLLLHLSNEPCGRLRDMTTAHSMHAVRLANFCPFPNELCLVIMLNISTRWKGGSSRLMTGIVTHEWWGWES